MSKSTLSGRRGRHLAGLLSLLLLLALAIPAATFASSTNNSATVDGGSSTIVAPGGTVSVTLNNTLTNGSSWHGTAWEIATSIDLFAFTCADTTNFDNNGSPLGDVQRHGADHRGHVQPVSQREFIIDHVPWRQ